jgi:citrate-Mg2+:H+ or citrate-Ca2+:H+ symporter, CitMHS family
VRSASNLLKVTDSAAPVRDTLLRAPCSLARTVFVMNMLAILGFVTIGLFLAFVTLTRTPVIVALVLVPLSTAVAAGFSGEVGAFALDGLRTVAPVAALIMFAVLYFGLMIDVGLFNPLIERLLAFVQGDPVRLCLATAALAMLVALDGDGATTFLISITALLPVHRRLGMTPLVLPAIVALAAGVMNLLPWGGPTARAMSVLRAGVDQLFIPVLPAMGMGIVWVFFVAWRLGRSERRRLSTEPPFVPETLSEAVVTPQPASRALFYFNAVLTTLVIVLLLQGLFPASVGLPELPAPLIFMVAFAIALPVNRRTATAERDQMASHAASAVLVVSMILAAGVFTGILNGSGMIKAMATVLASNIPSFVSPWLSQIVALTSMPLSLVFTPDVLFRGASGIRRRDVGPRPRSGDDRSGRDPWSDDDRLSAQSADRVDVHSGRTVGRLAPRASEVCVQMGARHDSRHDYRRVDHRSHLMISRLFAATDRVSAALSSHRAVSVAVSVLIGRSFSSRNRAQKSVAPPALTIAARITFAPWVNVSRFETPSSITVWRSL